MENFKCLVYDFGASNGRAYLAGYDGDRLSFKEVHRFINRPVKINGTFYWDFPSLWYEVKIGLRKAAEESRFSSIGIDTWGLDYGLIDKNGDLIQIPVHYRDDRCIGQIEAVREKINDKVLYAKTGIQFMRINTIYQLNALAASKKDILNAADDLLLMPDLFGYYLTGNKTQEYTMASTTGLLNVKTRQWDQDIIRKLDLPEKLFHEVKMPGSVLGTVKKEILDETGCHECNVVSVGGHDTASAVVAVPSEEKDFAYMSAGTWSLLGAEVDGPVLNELAQQYNFTNEGGANGTIRLLKNIVGLWLIQQCKSKWNLEGKNYSYAQIADMAEKAPKNIGEFDPDDDSLLAPEDMPAAILKLCRESGKGVPKSDASLARCVFENLARKYKKVFEELKDLTGINYKKLYIVGGGSNNKLLNQMTADALGIPVIAGPDEATVYGNAVMQLIAAGKIKDISEGRKLIKTSCELSVFEPRTVE